jgi:hypothetical protein
MDGTSNVVRHRNEAALAEQSLYRAAGTSADSS